MTHAYVVTGQRLVSQGRVYVLFSSFVRHIYLLYEYEAMVLPHLGLFLNEERSS